MTTDFATASVGTSQARTAAVEQPQSALHTEIRTLPMISTTLHRPNARADRAVASPPCLQQPALRLP
jgi:hypothetical protein